MRRTILLALLLPFALHAAAQTLHGPRLGLGISTVNAGQFLAWTGLPKLGLIGGWSFDVRLGEQVGVMMEPMYVSKGSLVQNAAIKQTTRTTLHYVELPIVLKLSVNKDPQGLFVAGGMVPGYLLGGRFQVRQDGKEISEVEINTQASRRTQFSVCLGMGVEKGRFELELRGTNSITPFDPVVRSQNLVIGLHATYRFKPRPEEPEEEEEDPE